MSSTQEMLHPTTAAVLDAIVTFKREHGGDSPTRREIATAVGLASTNTVQLHIGTLVDLGLIEVAENRPRCIRVAGARWVYDEARSAVDHLASIAALVNRTRELLEEQVHAG